MKKLYNSNTFLAVASVIIAIILWIYVVYEVNPMYETKIEDIPIQCINTSAKFDDGSLVITGENKNLLKSGITMDIRVKGKRNVVSSITKDNFTCTLDMITVTQSGFYTLKPSVESDISGLEILKITPYSVKVRTEDIEQRDIEISVVTKGKVPDGFSMDNVVNHNETIKVTGATSVIDRIKKAEAVLDYDKVDVKASETAAKIYFYDSEGNEIDTSLFKKTVEYAKLSFEFRTEKEVTVLLMPKYEDEVNKNRQGDIVKLSIMGYGTPNSEGGVEIKVKIKGPNVSIEKYSESIRTVYTEDIDVSAVSDSKIFDSIKAAPLSGNVDYVDVPEVKVKAVADKK